MAAAMSVMTQYGCFTSFAASSIADGNGGLILESKVIVGSEIQGEIAVIPKVINWAECDNSFTLSYNSNDADFKYIKSSKYDSDYIDLSNTTLPYDDGNIVVSNVGSGKIIFSISPKLKLNQKRLSCPLGEFVFEMKKTSTEFSFSNKAAADVESSVSASAAVTGNRVNISGTAPNNTDNQLSMMIVDKNNNIYAMDQYIIPTGNAINISIPMPSRAPSGEYFIKMGCRDSASMRIIKFNYQRPRITKQIGNITADIKADAKKASVSASADNKCNKSFRLSIFDGESSNNAGAEFYSDILPYSKLNNISLSVNNSRENSAYGMIFDIPSLGKLKYSVICFRNSENTLAVKPSFNADIIDESTYFKITVKNSITNEEKIYTIDYKNLLSQSMPIVDGSYEVNIEVYADIL